MIKTADYRVELRLDGVLIGDIRNLAQNLNWKRCRTASGVDSINFTLNDKLFAAWCEERNTTINDMLKPYALDARIIRNGEAVAGGFLATMPGYAPNFDSANLAMRFDGYLNLLAGVYIRPTAKQTAAANAIVAGWISGAETRATAAGKGFGITAGTADTLATIERTIENYKTVKEAITDLCDNIEGAGPFDVIFNPDRSYNIIKNLGRTITAWQIDYPTQLNGQSATSITAAEVQGFASHIIALGAGEVSDDPEKNTVISSEETDTDAVSEFGYVEQLKQYSSVSVQNTLNQKCATDLANAVAVQWQPQIKLSGRQVAPSPTAGYGLWLGDTIYINNHADLTGQTSGTFRVNTIQIDVSANGGETITPELERIA